MPRSQPATQPNHYRQIWQQHSEGYGAKTPTALDFEVGARVFKAGYSQKDVALVLVAGSPTVRRMAREQGKKKARLYATWVADLIVTNRQEHQRTQGGNKTLQMELGD